MPTPQLPSGLNIPETHAETQEPLKDWYDSLKQQLILKIKLLNKSDHNTECSQQIRILWDKAEYHDYFCGKIIAGITIPISEDELADNFIIALQSKCVKICKTMWEKNSAGLLSTTIKNNNQIKIIDSLFRSQNQFIIDAYLGRYDNLEILLNVYKKSLITQTQKKISALRKRIEEIKPGASSMMESAEIAEVKTEEQSLLPQSHEDWSNSLREQLAFLVRHPVGKERANCNRKANALWNERPDLHDYFFGKIIPGITAPICENELADNFIAALKARMSYIYREMWDNNALGLLSETIAYSRQIKIIYALFKSENDALLKEYMDRYNNLYILEGIYKKNLNLETNIAQKIISQLKKKITKLKKSGINSLPSTDESTEFFDMSLLNDPDFNRNLFDANQKMDDGDFSTFESYEPIQSQPQKKQKTTRKKPEAAEIKTQPQPQRRKKKSSAITHEMPEIKKEQDNFFSKAFDDSIGTASMLGLFSPLSPALQEPNYQPLNHHWNDEELDDSFKESFGL